MKAHLCKMFICVYICTIEHCIFLGVGGGCTWVFAWYLVGSLLSFLNSLYLFYSPKLYLLYILNK